MKKTLVVIPGCIKSSFSLKQPGQLKKLLIALFFVSSLLTSVDGWGQILYQSKGTGNWDDPATWSISVGGGPFDDATNTPSRNNNSGTTIISGHTVTLTGTQILDMDQLTVKGELVIEIGASFRLFNSATDPDLLVESGGKLRNASGIIRRGTGTPEIDILGTLVSEGEGTIANTISVTFEGASIYEHARDGGSIPIASWSETSTCSITGVVGDNPANAGQAFGNFSWNCPLMNENERLGVDATAMTVSGLFEVINTGSSQLRLFQPTLSVKGFKQTGGSFRIASGLANRTLNVSGDFSLSGGDLVLSSGAESAGVLNVGGNFAHTGGTIFESSSIDDATINFNGTTIQSFTGGGTYSGEIDFNINTNATVNFSGTADFSGSSGLFTNNGTLSGEASIIIPTGQITEPTTGTSGAALINEGTIAPGNSPGTIFILGALISTGTLSMEVSSTAHDIINVTGVAILTGSLDVTFIGGFVPTVPPDASYDLIQVTGLFLLDFLPAAVSVGPAAITTWDYGVPGTGTAGRLTITGVLPIDLVSFTGKRVDNTIKLNWRTATEENNDYMAVERSIDGSSFIEIGRVKGVGTTQEIQDYSLIDESPSPGANYYRLRQVDYDGAFEYHNVIFVDFIEKSSSRLLSVYPNPSTERMRVSWEAGDNTITELKIFNMTGQLLGTFEVDGENGNYELPVHNLAAGTYQLQLSQGSKMEAIRFVKH